MAQTANKTRKFTTTSTTKNPKSDFGENRILIHASGQIGFLGKNACKILGTTAAKAKNIYARDLLCFVDEEDAISASPFNMKEGVDNWLQSIRCGTHTLLSKKGEEVIFQFDQIASPEAFFVVASFVGEGAVPDGEPLEDWIDNTLVSDKKKVSKPTKTATKTVKKTKTTNAKKSIQDNSPVTTTVSSVEDNSKTNMFLELSNDVMLTCEFDGLLKTVNSQFTELLGYSQSQLEKLTFIDIIHPEDRPQVRPIIRNITDVESSQSRIIDFEARCVSRKGNIYPIEWKLKLDGELIYVVGQNVLTVRENEESLSDRQVQLSEAQAIARMGHWTWHIDSHKIDWSDEIYNIFGLDKDSFQPSIESLTKYLNRSDVGRTMQAFQRAMIEKRDYEMEFEIKQPSGEARYIKCQGRCKLDEYGDVEYLFGVMQDVTEQIEHERELQHAKESVERAYAAKSQFLANMSHELRTPLNAIIGFSEMMQRQLLGPIGTEKYLDYIKGIRESGEHLLDLITDILDMSKIEAGKYQLVTEEVNICKVIQLSMHMMEGRALDNNLKLTPKLESENIMLTADRRAITQVLLNLLSNAVKFTREKGEVSVSCKQLKSKVEIIVKDNGIGIPAMKLNSITNPFEQVSNQYTRDHDGSGLGLAITKELIELHGGEMAIESKVDVGTSVKITLPVSI